MKLEALLKRPKLLQARFNGGIPRLMGFLKQLEQSSPDFFKDQVVPEWDEYFGWIMEEKDDIKTQILGKAFLLRLGYEMYNMKKSVDKRESRKMLKLVEEMGFYVVGNQPEDYRTERVAIERKSDDMLSSIWQGQIFQKLTELRAKYDFAFLVVDRSLREILIECNRRGVYPNSFYGFIASCCVRGYPILFLDNKVSAATIMNLIFEKAYDGKDRTYYTPLRAKPKRRDYPPAIIGRFPMIDSVLADRLWIHFGSVQAVTTASKAELKEVEGIGDKKADEIYRLSRLKKRKR